MKKIVGTYRNKFERHLEKQCNRLTPKQQTVTVIIMITFFFATSLYVFTHAIYSIGVGEGKKQTEHINTFPITEQNQAYGNE